VSTHHDQIHAVPQRVSPQCIGNRSVFDGRGDIDDSIAPAFGSQPIELREHRIALTRARGRLERNKVRASDEAGDRRYSNEAKLRSVVASQAESLKDSFTREG
jgi:hypothetical protein